MFLRKYKKYSKFDKHIRQITTRHNTRYKQVGQKAKIKTVLYLEEKFKTEKINLLTPNLRVARER